MFDPFSFKNILAGIFILLLGSEALAALSPDASPFGVYGGVSYFKSLSRTNDRAEYLGGINDAINNAQISFGCESALQNFERRGGMTFWKNDMRRKYNQGYDRSMNVWPILYTLSICALAVSAARSYRNFREELHQVENPGPQPRIKRERNDRLY